MSQQAPQAADHSEYVPWPESPIWELQRGYYDQAGADAWRSNEVPHRITSHRPLAHAYAQCIAATYEDHRRASGPLGSPSITVVEIGAGHGQLAFHLVRELSALEDAGRLPSRWRYVMADISAANLEAWRAHPRLGRWLADGRVEAARYDAEADGPLRPEGHEPIGDDALDGPVVVVANYLFDVLRQDVLRVSDDGALERGLVRVRSRSGEPLAEHDPEQGPVDLELAYAFVPAPAPLYEHSRWEAAVRASADGAGPRTLLVPTAALALIERASAWSRSGALFLCADRGSDRVRDLPERVPGFGQHGGSFSLPINFGIVGHVLASRGGRVFQHRSEMLHLFAALSPPLAATSQATEHAFHTFLGRLDPIAVYRAARALASGEEPSPARLLAALRLSGWDDRLFAELFGFLGPRLSSLPWLERMDWREVLRAVFDAHFPLSDEDPLPARLGVLATALGAYGDALAYFAVALETGGEQPEILHAAGVCHLRRGAWDDAERLLGAAHRAGVEEAANLIADVQRWRSERSASAWFAEAAPSVEPLGWIHAERVAEGVREAPTGWLARRLFDGELPEPGALLERCAHALSQIEGLAAHLDPALGVVAISERDTDGALHRRWSLPGAAL